MPTIKKKGDKIIIDNRYEMYSDGVIYDTQKSDIIPQWIFEFKDFILKHRNTMI